MTALRYDPLHGVVRGVRAGVLTVPAVGGAALAHSFSGGCVSLIAVLAALGLCWPGAVALLGAQRRVPAVLGGLLASQVLAHVLLESACATPGHLPRSALQPMVGHEGLPMLAAHAVACLLLAVVLGRADAGLWTARRLARAASRSLRLCLSLPLPAVTPSVHRAPPVATAAVRPRVLWQAALPVRRGPPAACAP